MNTLLVPVRGTSFSVCSSQEESTPAPVLPLSPPGLAMSFILGVKSTVHASSYQMFLLATEGERGWTVFLVVIFLLMRA